MDNQEIFRKHIDAFAKSDWTTYKSLLTEDAVYDEEATQQVVKGRDQFVKAVELWKKAFPDLKAIIKSTVSTGDAVVAEVVWEGTHSGVLEGPMGRIPATGRHGKLAAVVLFRFENGKIRELRHYFDLMTILRQLGVSPRPTAPPAP